MNGLLILILLSVTCYVTSVRGTTPSDSACYGTNPDCDFYSLSCNRTGVTGEVIKLADLFVGSKDNAICRLAAHCNNSDVCCSKSENDVMVLFNEKNTFDAYNNCSGKMECLNVQAPWQQITLNQTAYISTYVYMEYACVSETNILNFCGSISDDTGESLTGSVVEVMFDSRKQNTGATTRTDCKCVVRSDDGMPVNVTMTQIDIRMHTYITKGNASQNYECSSSNFTSDVYNTSCVNSTNHHEDNFDFGTSLPWEITTDSEMVLYDVYKQDHVDSPAMVWVSLAATESSRALSVTCNEVHLFPVVTTSTTTTPPTTTTTTTAAPPTTSTVTPSTTKSSTSAPTTSTMSSQAGADAFSGDDDEDDDNTILYLAIFIPVGVLVLIPLVCIICWKYSQYKRGTKPLRYPSEGSAIGSFRDSKILDKFIYDITKTEMGPNSPAVFGDDNDPVNGRVSINPVYEPDTDTFHCVVAGYSQYKRGTKRLRYLSEGSAIGSFRDSKILDKFIYDITKTDMGPNSPAVFGDENDPVNGRVSINPVYEPDTVEAETSFTEPIKSVSATLIPPQYASNNLTTLMHNGHSQFARDSWTPTIPTTGLSPATYHQATGDSTPAPSSQMPNTDLPTVIHYKGIGPQTRSSRIESTPTTLNHTPQGVPQHNIRVEPATNVLRNTTTGNPTTSNHRQSRAVIKDDGDGLVISVTRAEPDATPKTVTKVIADTPKLTQPSEGAEGRTVGAQQPDTKTSVKPVKHSIKETNDGGVVIRIGDPPPHLPKATDTSSPAVIVPETVQERKSGTAHILPGQERGGENTVLFVSKP